MSKRYYANVKYWYAYHPKWDDFIKEVDDGYFVLGCIDLQKAFALPRSEMQKIVDLLNRSEKDENFYWHIHVVEPTPDMFELVLPRKRNLPLKPFEVVLGA